MRAPAAYCGRQLRQRPDRLVRRGMVQKQSTDKAGVGEWPQVGMKSHSRSLKCRPARCRRYSPAPTRKCRPRDGRVAVPDAAPLPASKDAALLMGFHQRDFRWRVRSGIRDAPHCPAARIGVAIIFRAAADEKSAKVYSGNARMIWLTQAETPPETNGRCPSNRPISAELAVGMRHAAASSWRSGLRQKRTSAWVFSELQ